MITLFGENPYLPKNFSLYDKNASCFYQIFEQLAWVGPFDHDVLPYQEMKQAVTKVYEQCGATLVSGSDLPPSAQDIAAMVKHALWGEGKNGYALEFKYAPENAHNTFVSCFLNGIDAWIKSYDDSVRAEDLRGLGIVAAIIVGIFLAMCALLVVSNQVNKRCGGTFSFWQRGGNDDDIELTEGTPLDSSVQTLH